MPQSVTMTINDIPFTNRQLIRFEQSQAPTTYWGHDRDGTLWIRARRFTLKVTARDASGNVQVLTRVGHVS